MIRSGLLQVIAQEANRPRVRAQDVFKAVPYTGNGTNRTIDIGLDLSAAGSLVWGSPRDGRYDQFWSCMTAEFSPNLPESNQYADFYGGRPVAGGISLRGSGPYNENTVPYMSWSFKKQARFFTAVMYTGNGVSGRTVAHDLGGDPGFVVVKRVDSATNWYAWHRGAPAGHMLQVNSTNASVADTTRFNAAPNSTHLTLGSSGDVNANGASYIAYLFAHEASLIQCGAVTVSGGNGVADLGWQPQFLLVKGNLAAEHWNAVDTARGWGTGAPKTIRLNGTGTEFSTASGTAPTASGFTLSGLANGTHLYVAIRAES